MSTRPADDDAPKTASNAVLWANVRALMVNRWGKENLTQLALAAKIGPGSATRIKEQKTSVGLDVLEKVAKAFGLQPWQLLVPNLSPELPPVLRVNTQSERSMYASIERARAELDSLLANSSPGELGKD